MLSWREIEEKILVIFGFTHPYYFTDDRLVEYFYQVAELTDMEVAFAPIVRHCEKIGLPDGKECKGQAVWGVWRTSGLSIYTWEIGKVTIVIHTCKDFQEDKVIEFTKKFFLMRDMEYRVVRFPESVGIGNGEENN